LCPLPYTRLPTFPPACLPYSQPTRLALPLPACPREKTRPRREYFREIVPSLKVRKLTPTPRKDSPLPPSFTKKIKEHKHQKTQQKYAYPPPAPPPLCVCVCCYTQPTNKQPEEREKSMIRDAHMCKTTPNNTKKHPRGRKRKLPSLPESEKPRMPR
jgi:hypothetical protein